MGPSGRIRVSDAERQAVAAQLHAATVEGRLTLEEFGDRSARVYASRTWADLASVIDDLPAPMPAGTMPRGMMPMAVPVARPATPSNLLPLLALIFGALSLPAATCSGGGALAGVAGIVLGILGLRRVRRGTADGRAMALIGIVCGGLGIVATVALMTLLGVVGFG
jgi:hypothetical protein